MKEHFEMLHSLNYQSATIVSLLTCLPRSDADEVFDTAKRVVDALDRARNASDAAETAITDTDEHMTDIENDLQMVYIDNFRCVTLSVCFELANFQCLSDDFS